MKNRDSFEQLAEVGYRLKDSSRYQNNLLIALLDASDGQVNVSTDVSAVLTNGQVCRIITNADDNTITFYSAVNSENLTAHGPYDCSSDEFSKLIIPGINMNINELMYDINDAMSLNSSLGILCDEICLHGEISISDATTIVNNNFISDSQTKLDLLTYISSIGVVITAQPMLQVLKDLSVSVRNAQVVDTSIFVDTTRAHIQAFVGTVIVGSIVTTVSMALVATANIAAVIIGFIAGAIYNVLITLKDRVDSQTNFQIDYTANAQLFENPVVGIYDNDGHGVNTEGLQNEGGFVRYTSLPGLAIYQWDNNFNIFLTADCDPFGLVTADRSTAPPPPAGLGYYAIQAKLHKEEAINVSITRSIYQIDLSDVTYHKYDSTYVTAIFPVDETSNLFYQSEQIQNWQIALRFASGLIQWFSLAVADNDSDYNTAKYYITVDGAASSKVTNDPIAVNSFNNAAYNVGLLAVRLLRSTTDEDKIATGEWIFTHLATFLDTLNFVQLIANKTSISNTIPGNGGRELTTYNALNGYLLQVGDIVGTEADESDMSLHFNIFCDRVRKLRNPILDYSESFQQQFSVLPVKRAYQFPAYQKGAFDRTLTLAITAAAAAGATILAGSVLIRRATTRSMIKSQEKLAAYRDASMADITSKPKFNAWANQNVLYNAKATIFGWPRIDMNANIGGAISLAPVLAAVATLDDATSKIQESVNSVDEAISDVSNEIANVQSAISDIPTSDNAAKLDDIDESLLRISNLIVK